MAELNYLNFDLLIEPVGQGLYRARVIDSPAGHASFDFQLPFTDQDLEVLMLRVGRARRGIRRRESPELQAAKNFGGKLFDSVFGGDVRAVFRSSYDAANRDDVGLRVRIRVNNAPELADLPWEFLYNPSLNRFITLSARTPLVRYIELPETVRPLRVAPPLRVLVMISNPNDYERLDTDKEWHNLNSALEDLQTRNLIKLEQLDQATLGALRRKLRQTTYNIFHFIGHGGFDEHAQDGVLVLEDELGHGKQVSGQMLGAMLSDHKSLRLAILNSCEGARSSKVDPFAGVAQSLIQQGIPAVIAMQFEITDEAAITFSHEFYTALTDGYPVDAALAEARAAIFAQINDLEWGTPVLNSRAADGVIFSVQPESPVAAPPPIVPIAAASAKTDEKEERGEAPSALPVETNEPLESAVPPRAVSPEPATPRPPAAFVPLTLPERDILPLLPVVSKRRSSPILYLVVGVVGLLLILGILYVLMGNLFQNPAKRDSETPTLLALATETPAEAQTVEPTTNATPLGGVIPIVPSNTPETEVDAPPADTNVPTETPIPATDTPLSTRTRIPPTHTPLPPTLAAIDTPEVTNLVLGNEFAECNPIADPYIESRCENGKYLITRRQNPSETHMIFFRTQLENAVIEVEAAPQPNVTARYGIVFRLNESLDRYYLLGIASNGRYGLFRYDTDHYEPLVPYTKSPLVNVGTTPNKIRIIYNGPTIGVELNGQLVLHQTDDVLTTGWFGMFVEADEANTAIEFDNLRVSEIR